MPRKEIRFAGFGGQGLLLAGIILGRTATIYQNLQATQTQSYGTEARGGASRCDVVIDDVEITFTGVTKPDIFVVMSQEACNRFIGMVRKGSVIYYESDLVKIDDLEGIQCFPVPATKMAIDAFGKSIVANIVMLGAVVEGTKILDVEQVKACIKKSVPPATVDLNLKAFDLGRSVVSMKKTN
jgi:2-oxoglutarate ferredoxin oxidoreductase subunit gamma